MRQGKQVQYSIFGSKLNEALHVWSLPRSERYDYIKTGFAQDYTSDLTKKYRETGLGTFAQK